MILYKGKLYETKEQERLLARLEQDINDTRIHRKLDISKVIDAVDAIGQKLKAGIYHEKIARLGIEGMEEQIRTVIAMTDRENLTYRLEVELGQLREPFLKGQVIKGRRGRCLEAVDTYIYPLGTLFHIAAGNREGLPVYSVLEGLLTGNINILKLPQADQGLSIEILQALLEIEPHLAEYIYVFDTPSTDLDAMCAMAAMSDGIVVWGGDEAVEAVRRFAPAGAKLIEWGHKLSFAYLSGLNEIEEAVLDRELQALAEHIVSTRQVLCSSCQVIYLDQPGMEAVKDFCNRLLPYLEEAAHKFPAKSAGMRADLSMRRYCETLQKIITGGEAAKRQVYAGKNCSLTVCEDMELELSEMFGNCLVKRLPREKMMEVLRRKKGCLQTAGLLCPKDKREELTKCLASCGVVRITSAGRMSETFLGEAHDGDYSLRRYVRAVDVEICEG
ncbi:long-chain acyl-protein thioester reductase [Lachnospiraceae bacterium]|nr:long-chain acyl-protein thioester reductase [Lachnospiraceae bacterium]